MAFIKRGTIPIAIKKSVGSIFVDDYFFCICDECGSTDWMEMDEVDGENFNMLCRDGTQKIKSRIAFFRDGTAPKISYGDFCCAECEKILMPISFGEISLKKRRHISKMSTEEKIEFAKNYLMLKEIERE